MQQTLQHRPAQQTPEWVNAMVTMIASAVANRLQHQLTQISTKQEQTAAAGSPYMTVPEAAVFLRCKPQRVYDLLSARTLGRYKDGGRVLIRRGELEMYVTAMEHARSGAQRALGRP